MVCVVVKNNNVFCLEIKFIFGNDFRLVVGFFFYLRYGFCGSYFCFQEFLDLQNVNKLVLGFLVFGFFNLFFFGWKEWEVGGFFFWWSGFVLLYIEFWRVVFDYVFIVFVGFFDYVVLIGCCFGFFRFSRSFYSYVYRFRGSYYYLGE